MNLVVTAVTFLYDREESQGTPRPASPHMGSTLPFPRVSETVSGPWLSLLARDVQEPELW